MTKAVRATGLEGIELERLRDRVGQLFAALQEAAEEVAPPDPGTWSPVVDLCEESDTVVVRIELPGVSVEQVEVVLTNTHLRVSGVRKRSVPRGRIVHLCSERAYGHFNRAVPLRWPVRANEATASLCGGVLTVRLPKLNDRRGAAFQITVKDDDGG